MEFRKISNNRLDINDSIKKKEANSKPIDELRVIDEKRNHFIAQKQHEAVLRQEELQKPVVSSKPEEKKEHKVLNFFKKIFKKKK